MTAREATQPLARAFFFDAAEIDFTLAFRTRDREPVLTIPPDDLAAHAEGQTTSGDWESVASISGDFPIVSAHEGSRFFYQQGAVAEAVLEQTVELYNVPDADIDGGNLVADLSAWQAHNYPDDQGQAIAEFLDVDGTLLGSIATPLQHVGTGGWAEVTASGAVPPGARQVQLELRAVLVAGSVPNIAFDDVSLTIQEQTNGGSVGRAVLVTM